MPYESRFAGLPLTDSVPRTPKGLSRGRIPRDYKEHPLGSLPHVKVFGDVLDVIPRSQWAQMLEAQEAAKSTLLDLRKSRGIQSLSQNGTSFCWINAPTQAIHYVRARMGQRKVLFSPASAGAPIKGFRNQGGWGSQGAEWIAEHGICPQEVWPANAIKREYYTEENKKIAAKYRITDWCELKPRSFDELATCMLLGLPVAIGLNWWSHEVLAVGLACKDGKWFLPIDNSWGPGYGENGIGLLTEAKGRPDDSVCLRLMTAA